MRLRFTLEALYQINAIRLYIEQKSEAAASHIVQRIFADCDRLCQFPNIGHLGSVPGTFEWTVAGLPYIIVHEIDARKDELIVLGVFHGAQAR